MDTFGVTMSGFDFKVLVDRGAQFVGLADGDPEVLGYLNFMVEGGGDMEVHAADGYRALVQSFDLGAGQVVGEAVFALPVAGLQEFLKQLPCKATKMEKVSVGFAHTQSGEGESVRIVAVGGDLAEPVETVLSIYPSAFPDLEKFFKVSEEMEYAEDVGRISLSAGTLFKIAMLAKPIKWIYKKDPLTQPVRLAYSQNESSPVMFSIEGPYPCYGLAMPMFVQWGKGAGN